MSVLCYSAKAGIIEDTKGQAHEKGTEEQPQEKRAVLTREEEARLEVVWGGPPKVHIVRSRGAHTKSK